MDHARVIAVKAKNTVSVLDVIRLIKYWNARPTMPSANSYLLENIVLNYFDSGMHSNYVDVEVVALLKYINSAIMNSVRDPKGIQGDLNRLTFEERKKIAERALADYYKAAEARNFEAGGKMREAINKWREVFGPDFPVFNA